MSVWVAYAAALWLLIFAAFILSGLDELPKVVTEDRSYVSESDFFEQSRQQSFWRVELPAISGRQKEVRPDWSLLRPSWREERKVEPR